MRVVWSVTMRLLKEREGSENDGEGVTTSERQELKGSWQVVDSLLLVSLLESWEVTSVGGQAGRL